MPQVTGQFLAASINFSQRDARRITQSHVLNIFPAVPGTRKLSVLSWHSNDGDSEGADVFPLPDVGGDFVGDGVGNPILFDTIVET